MPNQPRQKPPVDLTALPNVTVVAAAPAGSLTTAEIAERLCISQSAVRNRVYRHIGRGRHTGMPAWAIPGTGPNAWQFRFDEAACIRWERSRAKSRMGGARDGAGRPPGDGSAKAKALPAREARARQRAARGAGGEQQNGRTAEQRMEEGEGLAGAGPGGGWQGGVRLDRLDPATTADPDLLGVLELYEKVATLRLKRLTADAKLVPADQVETGIAEAARGLGATLDMVGREASEWAATRFGLDAEQARTLSAWIDRRLVDARQAFADGMTVALRKAQGREVDEREEDGLGGLGLGGWSEADEREARKLEEELERKAASGRRHPGAGIRDQALGGAGKRKRGEE